MDSRELKQTSKEGEKEEGEVAGWVMGRDRS